MLRSLCRYGIATWLGAIHAACGVYMGEPIRLFPEKAADAGGIPSSEACELDRTLVTGNQETTVAATGGELYDLAAREYTASLSWLRGGSTTLHVTLSEIQVYSVDATRNPEYDRWSQTPVCEDHATIEAALALRTDDGRLDEHVAKISFLAYDDYETHGSVSIERDALVGAYKNGAESNCFLRLNVRLLLARDGLHGTLGEDIEAGACDDVAERPVEELASARWGKRANNYGD
ncbi:MAG TPA: hypothetical protein VFX59_10490 [Polyangiales bacterium]|nr:hypothetical protein [Polyangiales bacterium]